MSEVYFIMPSPTVTSSSELSCMAAAHLAKKVQSTSQSIWPHSAFSFIQSGSLHRSMLHR